MRNIESRMAILNDMHRGTMEVQISDLATGEEPGTRVQIWLPERQSAT